MKTIMHKVAAPMLSAGIALTAFVGLAQTSYAACVAFVTGLVRLARGERLT